MAVDDRRVTAPPSGRGVFTSSAEAAISPAVRARRGHCRNKSAPPLAGVKAKPPSRGGLRPALTPARHPRAAAHTNANQEDRRLRRRHNLNRDPSILTTHHPLRDAVLAAGWGGDNRFAMVIVGSLIAEGLRTGAVLD